MVNCRFGRWFWRRRGKYKSKLVSDPWAAVPLMAPQNWIIFKFADPYGVWESSYSRWDHTIVLIVYTIQLMYRFSLSLIAYRFSLSFPPYPPTFPHRVSAPRFNIVKYRYILLNIVRFRFGNTPRFCDPSRTKRHFYRFWTIPLTANRYFHCFGRPLSRRIMILNGRQVVILMLLDDPSHAKSRF